MNRNEISTLLKFVSKTRILFNKTVSNQTIDADWRIFSYVISNHLENKLCTTTSIIQVSGLPFAITVSCVPGFSISFGFRTFG